MMRLVKKMRQPKQVAIVMIMETLEVELPLPPSSSRMIEMAPVICPKPDLRPPPLPPTPPPPWASSRIASSVGSKTALWGRKEFGTLSRSVV